MAVYSELSPVDQAIVDNVSREIRTAIANKAKGWNLTKAIADDTNAINIVMSIDAGAVIPNKTGMAGADDLTRTELVALYTLLNTDRTNNDTVPNRNAMSKAAGINGMAGV
jgi:hypothetical protein